MCTSDASLWALLRGDELFQERLADLVEKMFPGLPGSFAEIGPGAIIKDVQLLQDVKVLH